MKLPVLPEGWFMRDVQVIPARDSVGVEVEINAGLLGELVLFAMGSPNQATSAQVMQGDDAASIGKSTGPPSRWLSGGRTSKDLRVASSTLLASLR